MDFNDLAVAASADPANAIKYVDCLTKSMAQFRIDRSQRCKAMFVAQIAIESSHLSAVEESLYYKDAQRMANIYKSEFGGSAARAAPYTRNSKAFSDLRYQGYHGRGLIQLTWKDNYQAASEFFGIDFVADPTLLLQPEYAAMTACWYFAIFRPCLDLADQGNVTEVTRKINPALMHLDERKAQYEIAMGVAL